VLVSVTLAGTVSEEARRFMVQGVAAVEMAKSPADYEDAISKFEKAKSLAPDWPYVYYNLGLVQEKAGKYGDAVTTLKQYLRLTPNAKDAAMVRNLITKLEYKAENTLTTKDYAQIFVSLANKNLWNITGDCSPGSIFFSDPVIVKDDFVSVIGAALYYRNPNKVYKVIRIEGNKIKYNWTLDICNPDSFPGGCPAEIINEIEIKSRDKVSIRQYRGKRQGFSYAPGQGNEEIPCEYDRKNNH
jgi:tetratricopeptide (TPR) repeat protein